MINCFLCRGLVPTSLGLFPGICGRLKMAISSLHLLLLAESISIPRDPPLTSHFTSTTQSSRSNTDIWASASRDHSLCSSFFMLPPRGEVETGFLGEEWRLGRRFFGQPTPTTWQVIQSPDIIQSALLATEDYSHMKNHRRLQETHRPANSSPNCWPTQLWTNKMVVLGH